MTSPDYSPYAKEYAQSRPGYPPTLFNYLASLTDSHQLAWDCATGNGQAALELTSYFNQVVATDVSAEQIRHARQHPQISYRVAQAEKSGLENESVNLITVASAIHWFDLDSFYTEARRVIQPGGVLSAWSYHVGYVEPPFDQLFARFYREVVASYFAPGARFVDDRYENITLPGEALRADQFHVTADWNLDQMFAFIRSWSGTQQYLQERGEDPVAIIADELTMLWGERENVHTIRWPLCIRISRL